MYFTGKGDGASVEEFIQYFKERYEHFWRRLVPLCLRYDAHIWWHFLNSDKKEKISNEEFEQVLLDMWYHAKKKAKGLYPCGNILL